MKSRSKRLEGKGPSSMNSIEWGSHARDTYPTQDTLLMGTKKGETIGRRSRFKKNTKRGVRKVEERNVGMKTKNYEENDSLYHRSD